MEVRKRAAYVCLVQLCVLKPCSQKITQSLWYESRILASMTAVRVAIMKHVTASECGQTNTKNNGEWDNYAPDVLVTVMQMRVLS